MSYSAPDTGGRPGEDLVKVAEGLCGEPIVAVDRCTAGGNNRVYRVQTGRSVYALKCYGIDDRDRLGHEFDGLRFLATAGITGTVPRAIAADRTAACALYEWIEGERPTRHDAADVSALLDLLGAMKRSTDVEGARGLPDAAEATLRLDDVIGQIRSRLQRLAPIALTEPQLGSFLWEKLEPELERRLERLSGRDRTARLDDARQTLSPSDFGFHNALRRADGALAFLDLEYFGWDDPVKLTADFLWHPAMELSAAERVRFLSGATELYGGDPDFLPRLAVCYPLHGIRWCLIILNEFLPSMWQRRIFSGKATGDWDAAKVSQLEKAEKLLDTIHRYKEGHFA